MKFIFNPNGKTLPERLGISDSAFMEIINMVPRVFGDMQLCNKRDEAVSAIINTIEPLSYDQIALLFYATIDYMKYLIAKGVLNMQSVKFSHDRTPDKEVVN